MPSSSVLNSSSKVVMMFSVGWYVTRSATNLGRSPCNLNGTMGLNPSASQNTLYSQGWIQKGWSGGGGGTVEISDLYIPPSDSG